MPSTHIEHVRKEVGRELLDLRKRVLAGELTEEQAQEIANGVVSRAYDAVESFEDWRKRRGGD